MHKCGCGKKYTRQYNLQIHIKDKHNSIRPPGTSVKRYRGRPKNLNANFCCSVQYRSRQSLY